MAYLSLTYDGTTIELPEYRWAEEDAYSPIGMAVTETITLAKVIEFFEEESGMPFTLQPQAADLGRITLANHRILRAWTRVAGREITVGVGGDAYAAVFARPAITDASPLLGFSNNNPAEWWRATYHLMSI